MNRCLGIVMFLAVVMAGRAATDELPFAQFDGPELARQLLLQTPDENSTLTGILRIRANRKTTEIPVSVQAVVTGKGWESIYETTPGTNGPAPVRLVIAHDGTNANRYELDGRIVEPGDTAVPFAGTDFWLSDLGLEFLHWPVQRVVKKEFRRNCACVVLESVNPTPGTNDYTRVLSWIDEESGGIVQAEAYQGTKKLKYFAPKDFKKVNGQWRLEEMQIENVRTGSRTRLEFNLDSK